MREQQQSIHPRVWLGGKKKDTSKPPSRMKIDRAAAGIRRHLESHPHDGMSQARLAKLQSR